MPDLGLERGDLVFRSFKVSKKRLADEPALALRPPEDARNQDSEIIMNL